MHAFLSLILAIVVIKWVSYELGLKKVSFKKYRYWLLAALLLQFLANLISYIISGKFGNFLLHSIGGGMASTLLFVYLFKTLNIKTNFRILSVALFMFISTLGVLNEIMEYAMEESGFGLMSFDTHDTWRDLVANTLGAVMAWGLILILFHYQSSQKQR